MGLIEDVLNGDIAAAAKLITIFEDDPEQCGPILDQLAPHTGKAHIIGITGHPGSGKSTLVGALLDEFRKRGKSVSVIAIDSSSPFTGGAVLGDRIRMQKYVADEPSVFIRSMATRGNLGGLAKATHGASCVMDAMGRDIILIETVGVGQVDVEIARIAHTTIVVLTPGMGDSIQAMKAGILEVADLFIINKADREGAEMTERDIQDMLLLSHDKRKHMGVFMTVATECKGITEIVDALEQHRGRKKEFKTII